MLKMYEIAYHFSLSLSLALRFWAKPWDTSECIDFQNFITHIFLEFNDLEVQI